VYNSGRGANALQFTQGQAVIDSAVDAGAGNTLASTISGGAQMTTARLNQSSLSLSGAGTKVTIQPGGALANVLETLSLDATSTLDLTNNDLILRATALNKDAIHSDAQAKILTAQNGVDLNFVTNWDGPGITSSAARAANVAATFDLTALGVIRNSDLDITTGLPGSSYPSFGGVPVTADDVLIKYTYTGDGNLDGAVTFDDYAAMDAAFFGTIQNLGWATGDINFDAAINFDDYAVVDQAFFQQTAPLAAGGSPLAAAPPSANLQPGLAPRASSLTEVAAAPVVNDTATQVSALADEAQSIATSEDEGTSADTNNLQAADSLADARLSVTKRSHSRDLWDDALLDIVSAD
jgi:hypothetical protein